MLTFTKNIEKMSAREMRQELKATQSIIDDIYDLTRDSIKGRSETAKGKQNVINQIARYCCREMPK